MVDWQLFTKKKRKKEVIKESGINDDDKAEAPLTKHSLIVDVLDAEPQACREGAHQDVEVEEEGDPGGWLVLRHRRYDGDVDLGIAAKEMKKRERKNRQKVRMRRRGRGRMREKGCKVVLGALGTNYTSDPPD